MFIYLFYVYFKNKLYKHSLCTYTMASTTATTTPASTSLPTATSLPVQCRKCDVTLRTMKGEECLTPVGVHAIGCPKGAEDGEEPQFSFPPLCIECFNQEKWREAYQAWEADNSLELPCPGAPRVHTCGR